MSISIVTSMRVYKYKRLLPSLKLKLLNGEENCDKLLKKTENYKKKNDLSLSFS